MEKAVNKKDYLKKYLAGGDKKKRKKKVTTTSSSLSKSKIIDDDLDLRNMRPLGDNELEIYDLAEDAPQVAGIVDDRPEEVQVMSQYRETKKWKIVTREYEDVQISAMKGSDSDLSPSRGHSPENSKRKQKKVAENLDSDASVERKRDSDASPPRKREQQAPSHGRTSRKHQDGSDPSPPRKEKKRHLSESDVDISPPRRKKPGDSDSDASPKRRKKHGHSRVKTRWEGTNEREVEPSRKQRHEEPKERDMEPPRRQMHEAPNERDMEPPRRHRHGETDARDMEVLRRRRHKGADERAEDPMKRRRYEESSHKTTRKESDERERLDKVTKTLEGKKAGLQNAADMKVEAAEIRRKHAESLAQLGDDVSGRGATAVVRDRKTGKRRDLKEEAKQKREKDAKNAEIMEQYAVWGKGMKQIDERAVKMKEDLHEMSKPVARYADDEDLEEMRRNEEREGDPMLEYMRSKRKKEVGGKVKPQYHGSYLPNRYGIKPGHRWDGVDRSTGYEKKWFDERNARKAQEEEAFKWSTEDM